MILIVVLPEDAMAARKIACCPAGGLDISSGVRLSCLPENRQTGGLINLKILNGA